LGELQPANDGRDTSVARKPPTARDIERVVDEAENAIVGARSDVARWVAAAPAGEYAGRQRVDCLLAEAQAKYREALGIVRTQFIDGAPQRYPIPPTPLHPGAA
jgi:hypothetical protein